MAKKQNLSHTKKKKANKEKDLCPICEKDLYYDDNYTQRIGIINTTGNHEVLGWICPHCRSEFDKSNKVMYIYGENFDSGDA